AIARRGRGGLTRRQLIGSTAATTAALATRRGNAAELPRRREFVVAGTYALTMDDELGDVEECDIHVRNGAIVAVGKDLDIDNVQEIDGSGMITLPGLIDTHNHLWNSTCRNIVQEGPEKGYFPTVLALGKEYTPDDSYRGVRLGCAEALYS